MQIASRTTEADLGLLSNDLSRVTEVQFSLKHSLRGRLSLVGFFSLLCFSFNIRRNVNTTCDDGFSSSTRKSDETQR